eukprot:jgi/Chlat1/338/Chrsp1S03196
MPQPKAAPDEGPSMEVLEAAKKTVSGDGMAAKVAGAVVSSIVGNIATGGALSIAMSAAGIVLGFGDLAVRLYTAHKQLEAAQQYELVNQALDAIDKNVKNTFKRWEAAREQDNNKLKKELENMSHDISLQIEQASLRQTTALNEVRQAVEQVGNDIINLVERQDLLQFQRNLLAYTNLYIEYSHSHDDVYRAACYSNLTTIEPARLLVAADEFAKDREYSQRFPFKAVRIMVMTIKDMVVGATDNHDILNAVQEEVQEIVKLLEAEGFVTYARYIPALAWLKRVAEPLRATATAIAALPGTSSISGEGSLLQSIKLQPPVKAATSASHDAVEGVDLDAVASDIYKEFSWVNGIHQRQGADAFVMPLLRTLELGLPSAMKVAATALEGVAQTDEGLRALQHPEAMALLQEIVAQRPESVSPSVLQRLESSTGERGGAAPAGSVSNQIAKVVKKLRAGLSDSKEGAARALVCLLEDAENGAVQEDVEVKELIREAIPPLLALLQSGADVVGKAEAAHALAIVADVDPESRRSICEAKGIPLLVALLRSGMDDSKGWAARALANIALTDVESRSLIRVAEKEDGIPALVALLRSGTHDSKAQAARALAYVTSTDVESRRLIRVAGKEDGIAALVALLQFGTADGKAQAALALGNVACEDESRSLIRKAEGIPPRSIREAGGIPLLVKLLQSGTGDSKAWAARALGSVALTDTKSRRSICDAGGLPLLVELLRSGTDDDKAQAARALGNVAHDGAESDQRGYCSRRIREAGAIPLLVELLRSGTDNSKAEAASALGSVATTDTASRRSIGEAKGVYWLVELVRAGTQPSEKAEIALRQLVDDKQCEEEMESLNYKV